MQRFVPLSLAALLVACSGNAQHPAIAPAPELAEAPPAIQRDDGQTLLVDEPVANPPQLHAELVAPQPEAPVPGGTQIEPESPTPAPQPALAELAGAYRYKSGKSSATRAIDGVVDEMSVIVRGIARKRLVASNPVPKTISIQIVDDEVTLRMDGRSYTGKLGGGSHRVSVPGGETSSMRFKKSGPSLQQLLHASEGDRTNTFTPREDGGIDMSVRIHSDRLPKDVRYRVTFAKQ